MSGKAGSAHGQSRPSLNRELSAIVISAFATIVIGSTYVFTRWALRHQPIDGALRCVTLACALIAIHAWGLDASRRQNERSLIRRALELFGTNLRQVRAARCIGLAFVQQAILWAFSAIVLDGGQLMMAVGLSICVFWLVICIALFTRTSLMTKVDIALVKFGFIPLILLFAAAQSAVWHLKGVG